MNEHRVYGSQTTCCKGFPSFIFWSLNILSKQMLLFSPTMSANMSAKDFYCFCVCVEVFFFGWLFLFVHSLNTRNISENFVWPKSVEPKKRKGKQCKFMPFYYNIVNTLTMFCCCCCCQLHLFCHHSSTLRILNSIVMYFVLLCCVVFTFCLLSSVTDIKCVCVCKFMVKRYFIHSFTHFHFFEGQTVRVGFNAKFEKPRKWVVWVMQKNTI